MFRRILFGLFMVSFSGMASADTAALTSGAGLGQFAILGVFIFFLFWMMRSQNKRAKEHQNLINKLDKGDEVLINGGMVGKVTKVGDTFILVQFSEGFECLVQKNMIAASLPKGTIKSVKL
ncbi:MAG TPA: preprotein translocase subunit YajC [Gammaproteobacteria bacterium]|nr:preprotein translocase subunit YajC [Gammaproteobacteria bacterium]